MANLFNRLMCWAFGHQDGTWIPRVQRETRICPRCKKRQYRKLEKIVNPITEKVEP